MLLSKGPFFFPLSTQMVGSGIPQERNEHQAPAIGHSEWKPHPIQGWAPDFIPYVLQEAIDNKYYDELIPVSGPYAR